MLKLENITKIFNTAGFKQKALDGVSINFRKNEFVSILGPSGSGKTTLLNIIGGLDHYTNGNLIINGVSTKDYTSRDLDTYRNHLVGFVFQSYNLIPHQTILSNVELSLTLSGVKKGERKRMAYEALEKVGLKDHIHKKPMELSGGQMQRVAIARALVNNPDIVLADEPTGALDSVTSSQVMDLLKEIAKDKLVVMVTHNEELARDYSTRIIELRDGKILGDTNPYDEVKEKEDENSNSKKSKKTSMSFFTALSLSLNNLLTKKGRTILTAFAGSIGIVGIALILSLSSGVQNYVNRVEEETLTSYPIKIGEESLDIGSAFLESAMKKEDKKEDIESGKIKSNDVMLDTLSLISSKVKTNNLEKFKEYIENDGKKINDYTTSISYTYGLELQIYSNNTENGIIQVNPNTIFDSIDMGVPSSYINSADVFSAMLDNKDLNNKMYSVVAGRMPEKYNELVVVVDENNEINDYLLYTIGLKSREELKESFEKMKNGEKIEVNKAEYTFDDILNTKFKLLYNTDYYEKQGKIYINKKDDENYLKEKIKNAEDLVIVGIIKPSENSSVESSMGGGIFYLPELEKHVIQNNNDSEIVKYQKENKDINVFTGMSFETEKFDMQNMSMEQKMYMMTLSPEEIASLVESYRKWTNSTYESVLKELAAYDFNKPRYINIYPKDFESKDNIKDLIKEYNEIEKEAGREENIIEYSDLVGALMSSVTIIVDMISYVLIAFVSISLVVSSIMIGIITYISVLERTKEIGILRAIGASKKDVSRVFNAETLIIGLIAGLFGILITVLLNIPINLIIKAVANISNLSMLPIGGAIILVAISVILTMIAGIIPAKMASKKDPVESLRCE